MKLHYDYDELRSTLCRNANAAAENLSNPNLLFVRETKYDIIETTIQDYYDSGKALKYHNQYCMDNGLDEVVTDVSLLNEDAWLLREKLSEWYPLFVGTIISDYEQERRALNKIGQPSKEELDIQLAQARQQRIEAEQRLEETKRQGNETLQVIGLVFAIVNGIMTFFLGLIGFIFRPALLIAMFFLSMCVGFSLAVIKDSKNNAKRYRH